MRKVAVCVSAIVLTSSACGGSNQATRQSSRAATSPAPVTSSTGSAPKSTSAGSRKSATPILTGPAPLTGGIASVGSPPKTGTYRFIITYNGKRSTRDTAIASEGSSASSGTKQAEKVSSDKATSTQHVIWRRDGKYLAEIESQQGSNR